MTKFTALLVCLLPFLVRSAPVSVDGYAAVVSTNVITASEVMSFIQAENEPPHRLLSRRGTGGQAAHPV
ncbi:MAG: hypothetical protein U1F77_11630 [Kiritimatiellia bacterium]